MARFVFIVLGVLFGVALWADFFGNQSTAENAKYLQTAGGNVASNLYIFARLFPGAVIGGIVGYYASYAFNKGGRGLTKIEEISSIAFVGMVVLEVFFLND